MVLKRFDLPFVIAVIHTASVTVIHFCTQKKHSSKKPKLVVELGTQNKNDVDYDWLPQHTIDNMSEYLVLLLEHGALLNSGFLIDCLPLFSVISIPSHSCLELYFPGVCIAVQH